MTGVYWAAGIVAAWAVAIWHLKPPVHYTRCRGQTRRGRCRLEPADPRDGYCVFHVAK